MFPQHPLTSYSNQPGRTDKSERDAELSRKYDINIKRVDLDALAHQSDAVILLAAMSPDMKHIVGRDFLQKMKKTAVVINVARGPLVVGLQPFNRYYY